jgi:hypothetical protein
MCHCCWNCGKISYCDLYNVNPFDGLGVGYCSDECWYQYSKRSKRQKLSHEHISRSAMNYTPPTRADYGKNVEEEY